MFLPKIDISKLSFFISSRIEMTGSNSNFIGGLVGPTHKPARIILLEFVRTFTGKFKTNRYTGHILTVDDLKTGTLSVDNEKAKLIVFLEGGYKNLSSSLHPKYLLTLLHQMCVLGVVRLTNDLKEKQSYYHIK